MAVRFGPCTPYCRTGVGEVIGPLSKHATPTIKVKVLVPCRCRGARAEVLLGGAAVTAHIGEW